ncbi:uncharacterized protein LOC120781437 [Bactrocera tryoni]|uniref:uncharacterized protein LOC120781437 n=1 Tax=Bactrocera tryoni TaxID=59916 RepID=UPI001A961432|nr:uncharacterized protein LOC120781437 [Bactrocera tryoni]
MKVRFQSLRGLSGANIQWEYQERNKTRNIQERLEKLEENICITLQNQKTLSEGQSSMVHNQTAIFEKLNEMESKIVEKAEVLAQNKSIRECKVLLKRVEQSVCRMTGEVTDKELDDVASTFPMESQAIVAEVEDRLQSQDYAQTMTTFLHKLKGASDNVADVMPKVFSDELLEGYNWDGRWSKKSLCKGVGVSSKI